MRQPASLARDLDVRMHTHLAETREEDAYCRQTMGRPPAEDAQQLGWLGEHVWVAARGHARGRPPAEYGEEPGWLGEGVWLAPCVHLDEAALKRFAATGTSVAH